MLWIVLALGALIVLAQYLAGMGWAGSANEGLGWKLFTYQDRIVLPFMILPLLLGVTASPSADHWWPRARLIVPMVALLLLLVCWAGHYGVMLGYDLSRDEQMAVFDSWIFAHGQLSWPLPLEWRDQLAALNRMFILPVAGNETWVSTYLPGNAAFRALVGTVATPTLTSPLFTAVGALALWNIARQLWPKDKSIAPIVLLLYAGSSQVVLNGMTAYAMSAHLGLNLMWLMLFLRGGKWGHGAALVVGFCATGLHQPIFHPMFVAPFMLLLLQEKRWRVLGVYGLGYIIITAFWLVWPIWMGAHGTSAPPVNMGGGVDYVSRLTHALKILNPASFGLMTLNLLRFVSWQHLMVLPLGVFGAQLAWRGNRTAQALLLGIVIPVIILTLIVPYQGHGWGYRYLHGVIGNACLLGGYGWQVLRDRGVNLNRSFLIASFVSILVLLPIRAWQVHKMVSPYADLDRRISASGADIAIVSDVAAPFAQDMVHNRPDLSNRPLRFLGSALTVEQMKALCSGQRVQFVGRDMAQSINDYLEPNWATIGPDKKLIATMRDAGCLFDQPGTSRAGSVANPVTALKNATP